MKIDIVTIQHEQVYFDLKAKGHYTASKHLSLIDDVPEFTSAYDYIAKSMHSRNVKMLFPPSSSKDILPVWGWYKRGDQLAPNFIESYLEEIASDPDDDDYDSEVIMHLRIDEERLLLSDFDLWHAVLNDTPTILGEDKEASWEYIFDLTKASKILEVKSHEQYVQATFWEILLEDVVSAKLFKDR
jgi:hypothetical protein